MMLLSRRAVLASAAALAACGPKQPAPSDGQPKAAAANPKTLEGAVAGAWRLPADKARDPFRHPVESLKFWGLKPGATVVEFWPGAGWYTDILAPFLAATGGKLYAAQQQVTDPADTATRAIIDAYTARFGGTPRLYGKVEMTAF